MHFEAITSSSTRTSTSAVTHRRAKHQNLSLQDEMVHTSRSTDLRLAKCNDLYQLSILHRKQTVITNTTLSGPTFPMQSHVIHALSSTFISAYFAFTFSICFHFTIAQPELRDTKDIHTHYIILKIHTSSK